MLHSHRWLLFLLLGLFASCGATCPRRLQSPNSLAPIAFLQPPDLQQIAQTINTNTSRVRSLQAQGTSLTILGMPTLKTSLALERPVRFRLRAKSLMGAELDLGSNDELFWMWAKRSEPPATYYARHSELDQGLARNILPMPPHWLIESLGLVEIDPQLWDGPYPRGAGRIEIRGRIISPSGNLTKVLVLDDQRGWILEHQVYDATGQLLATALATHQEYDPVHQVTLPLRVDIQLPPAQLAFALEVDGFQINRLDGDPLQLWSMPRIPGSQLVPVAGLNPAATIPSPSSAAPSPQPQLPPEPRFGPYQVPTPNPSAAPFPPSTSGPVGWKTGNEFMTTRR